MKNMSLPINKKGTKNTAILEVIILYLGTFQAKTQRDTDYTRKV